VLIPANFCKLFSVGGYLVRRIPLCIALIYEARSSKENILEPSIVYQNVWVMTKEKDYPPSG